jgi:hypothetical protein
MTIVPLSYVVFAEDGPSDKNELGFPRRISVNVDGYRETLQVSQKEKHRVVFADGQDWHFERKGEKWLIIPGVYKDGQPQLYLSFRAKEPVDPKAELVRLVEQCDETCLWHLDFEAQPPEKTSTRWCFASPASGAFQGWFLAAGDPIEMRGDFVLARSVTLHKDKSPKSRLRLWIDGP